MPIASFLYMSSTNRIIKNTGFLYIRMAITVLISLYTTRIVLNSLGSSDFGIFGIVGGVIGMLSFLDAAMASSTQRFLSFVEGEGNKLKIFRVFNVSIVLHLGVAAAVVCILELGYIFFFGGILNIQPDRLQAAKYIYHFMAVSTLFTIITVPFDAAINAHEDMLFYAVSGVIESLLKLGAACWVVYSKHDKLILYGVLTALVTIITLIIKQIYCFVKYQECRIHLGRYFDKSIFREITHYASWNFVSSIGVVVGNYGSGIVVNHFFGTAVNAAQGVTGQLNGQLLSFSNNMLKAINPVIVKSEGKGDRESMLKYSLTGCKLSYILLAVFAIPFLIETPYILKLWLKNVPGWTMIFSRLFIITTMLQQLTITLGTTIGAMGKIKTISLFNSALSLIPNILYIIIFTLGGSPVWLYVLILIDLGIISGVFVTYQCVIKCGLNLNLYIKEVVVANLISSLLALLVGYGITLLQQPSLVRLLEILFVCPSLYLWFAYRFSFNRDEKIILSNLLKNKLFKKS